MNKLTPGPCKEIVHGATPHGGIYMISFYFDSKYVPVPKEAATRVIVHEYDEKNRSIFREYISCGPNDEEEFTAMEAYELAERPAAPQPPQQKPRQKNARPQRKFDGPKPARQDTPGPRPQQGAQRQGGAQRPQGANSQTQSSPQNTNTQRPQKPTGGNQQGSANQQGAAPRPKQGKRPDGKRWEDDNRQQRPPRPQKPRPSGRPIEPEELSGEKQADFEKRRPPRRRKPQKPAPTPTTTE